MLDFTRPLQSAVSGRRLHFIGFSRDGKAVLEAEGGSLLRTNRDGTGPSGQQRVVNTPVQTKRVITVYPTGERFEQPRPTRTSIYGTDQLIQVEVIEENGRIVSKRLLP